VRFQGAIANVSNTLELIDFGDCSQETRLAQGVNIPFSWQLSSKLLPFDPCYHRMIIWVVSEIDRSLDTLLLLDGETFIVESRFWVKFVVKQVPVSFEKPHGLDYSLTLHDGENKRLLGFDNAHPVSEGTGPGAPTRIEYDHKHKGARIRFYFYADAATLLNDFRTEVDLILKERSSMP
jgi:hypothetical protein